MNELIRELERKINKWECFPFENESEVEQEYSVYIEEAIEVKAKLIELNEQLKWLKNKMEPLEKRMYN
jgi:hypothetical protein